jgi:hypothetical protein
MQTCDDDKLNLTGSSQAMAQRTEDAMGQAALRATARWWPEVRRRQQRMEPTTAGGHGMYGHHGKFKHGKFKHGKHKKMFGKHKKMFGRKWK